MCAVCPGVCLRVLSLCTLTHAYKCVCVCVCVYEEDRGGQREAKIVCLCVCHYCIEGSLQNAVPQAGQSLAEESNKALMGSKP